VPSAPIEPQEPQLQNWPGLRHGLKTPSSADLFDWLFTGLLAHPSGGIAGWRDRRTGRLSDEYPEISGYFLSAAVFADAMGSPVVIRAADWLIERIEQNTTASRRVDGPAIYNFDQGIIAAGLIKYGVRARQARAVAAGIHAASRLRDQVEQHGYLPTLDRAAGQPLGRAATWSTVGRLHLSKTVQCLLLAAELGASGMRDAARRIIDDVSSAFSLQSDGLRDATGAANLHAACYALEGLWIWDTAQRTTGLRAVLEAAFDELVSYRLPSGSFPRTAVALREQSDVLAQLVRLAVLLGRESTVGPSTGRLRDVATPTRHGWAVPYEPQAPEVHENAWATMFAAQALALVDGPPDLEWWELI
jgi:hypothetical protein